MLKIFPAQKVEIFFSRLVGTVRKHTLTKFQQNRAITNGDNGYVNCAKNGVSGFFSRSLLYDVTDASLAVERHL